MSVKQEKKKVDLVDKQGLKLQLKDIIFKEVIYASERNLYVRATKGGVL